MNERKNMEGKKRLRVGVYLRLSDEDEDKQNKNDDSESIKNQRNLLLDEIAKRPDFILVDEYCDEDLSGAGTYRPNFERLIRDCESGKIDIVLCKSQSRFSRDMEIIEKYLHNKFVEWNIRFIGISDNADTSNAGNKKSRQINGLVNEWYLEDSSNNIRSAFHSKMKQGEFISPFTSYGYEISKENNNKLIIDQVASEIVKDIFTLYLSGLGFTAIAKYLNNKNISSPSFYKYQKGIKLNIISNRSREEIKWSANAIKTILTNEIYLGHLVQGKRTTLSYKNHKIQKKAKELWIKKENTHQAIISKEIFSKVKISLKERTKPVKNTGMVHNFSGKVFCLECGRYFRKKSNSKGLNYLNCSNNFDGYCNCCNKQSIRYDILEKLVLNSINEKVEKYFDEEQIKLEEDKKVEAKFIEKINFLEHQKIEIEKKVKKNKNYLKNIYQDKVNEIITKKQFKELLCDYQEDGNSFKSQMKQIENDIHFYKSKEQLCFTKKEQWKKYQTFNELNRVIVEEFIESIYIGNINKNTNTRDIKIKWNI